MKSLTAALPQIDVKFKRVSISYNFSSKYSIHLIPFNSYRIST